MLAMLAISTLAPMAISPSMEAAMVSVAPLDFFPQEGLTIAAIGGADPTLSETVALTALEATGTFTVRWTYSAEIGSTRIPIAGAFVELRRSTTSSYAVEATTFTDEQGYANFQNVAAGTLAAVVFTDDHSSVKVLDGVEYEPYSWTTGWKTHSTGTTVEQNVPDNNRAAWSAYAAVRTASAWLKGQTGYARSSVNVNWPDGDWPHSHGDDIDLPNSGEYSDAIWDTATIAHEYGHCVQYAMLGDRFPDGDGPDPHYIYSESSPGFAFSEGWAQFFASAVTGNPYRSSDRTSLESTIYADGAFGYDGDQGDWDGNIVEGAVANVLWDITDGASESDRPSFGIIGDRVDSQFPALWKVMSDHKTESIDDVWFYWDGKDANLQGIFYNARIKKDMSTPTNPNSYYSSHDIGVESDDSTVTVTLTGASDTGGEVAGYSVLWDNSPTGMPDAIMDVSGSVVTSSNLGSGRDWYLHVRAVDGSGNWATDSYTVGPFRISPNAVAQGEPLLQLPSWLPLLAILAIVCIIIIALASMAVGRTRREREREEAERARQEQAQNQQVQYQQPQYQYNTGAYPPPGYAPQYDRQQPSANIPTYYAPVCPRCGRVDMGSIYCPYCGWRMR
jgi:hypothetical protein